MVLDLPAGHAAAKALHAGSHKPCHELLAYLVWSKFLYGIIRPERATAKRLKRSPLFRKLSRFVFYLFACSKPFSMKPLYGAWLGLVIFQSLLKGREDNVYGRWWLHALR